MYLVYKPTLIFVCLNTLIIASDIPSDAPHFKPIIKFPSKNMFNNHISCLLWYPATLHQCIWTKDKNF